MFTEQFTSFLTRSARLLYACEDWLESSETNISFVANVTITVKLRHCEVVSVVVEVVSTLSYCKLVTAVLDK